VVVREGGERVGDYDYRSDPNGVKVECARERVGGMEEWRRVAVMPRR